MIWNDHSRLKGDHALLSPSSVSWINYPNEVMEQKMRERYSASLRTQMGTALHEFAADSIELRQKMPTSKKSIIQMIRIYFKGKGYSRGLIDFVSSLPDEVFTTIIDYVNDGIGFKMDVEQILYYSFNCFGTADAISFKNNTLRISDLKTGQLDAHIEQLYIYAALFCLEYNFKPSEIKIELRLYQNANVIECEPSVEDIVPIMDRIISADKILSAIKGE